MLSKVLLIIPTYNEEKRLHIEAFKNSEYQFLFANDGSTDKTLEILKSIESDRIHIFDSKVNLGKSNIIQAAYQYAKSEQLIQDIEWIGYWDADLATPLFEVTNMLDVAEGYDSVWGSRVSRLGSKIERSPKRHYLGRIFATIMSLLFGIKSYDSQCGAKLFKVELADKAFEKPFLTSWIFDVEILLRLRGEKMIEYPLKQWVDVAGSKVNIFKELPRVIGDIIKLWKAYR